MSAPVRYRDIGRGLLGFADRIEVLCLRCERPGTVHKPRGGESSDALFVCKHCSADARSERGDWAGWILLQGQRPCGACGHQWIDARLERAPAQKLICLPECGEIRDFDSVDVACPRCAHVSPVSLNARRLHSGHDRDPHLGLPLRLVERTRAGVLWAYNAEHIDEIRRYVAAEQRERRSAFWHRTMISHLPTWMKLARHRSMMLKALDRLTAKLAESRAG